MSAVSARPTRTAQRWRLRWSHAQRLPPLLVCVLVGLFVLFPLVVTVLGGLRTNGDLLNAPFSAPKSLEWSNYGQILGRGSVFWPELVNSLIILVATVAVLLAVACPAAFALARITFPGREIVFNTFLFGLLFPLTVAVLPLYITIRQLGLLNTPWGVVLPQVAFGLPTTILILRNFFLAIPQELEEAAAIDGASVLGIFWRIALPLSRPALSVVSMLAVVGSWNNFLLPLLVLNDPSQWTLPLGATQFQGQYATDWAKILAFVTLSLIPAVVVYLFGERQLVAGLTAGAVKE